MTFVITLNLTKIKYKILSRELSESTLETKNTLY